MNVILVVLVKVDHLPTNLVIKFIERTSQMYKLYQTTNSKHCSLLVVMKKMPDTLLKRHETSIKVTKNHCSYSKTIIFHFLKAKQLQFFPNGAQFYFTFCLVDNLVQLCRIKTFKRKMGPLSALK